MNGGARAALTAVCLVALASPALAQAAKTASPAPPASAPAAGSAANIDLAYGAYERGFYLTAFNLATQRAAQNDAAAMTLLGELYAQGLGVGHDDKKAADWYRLGAEHGDPNAMFSLAMFNMAGRGGLNDHTTAVKLLEQAAKLGQPLAKTVKAGKVGQPLDQLLTLTLEQSSGEDAEAGAQKNGSLLGKLGNFKSLVVKKPKEASATA